MKTVLKYLTLPAIASLVTADTKVLQYDTYGFSVVENVATWNTTHGNNALVQTRPDWHPATRVTDAIIFNPDNQIASPFHFQTDTTNTIYRVFAIVRLDAQYTSGNIENITNYTYSTLINAPCAVRFSTNHFDNAVLQFEANRVNHATSIRINTEDTTLFYPSAELQLVEVEFVPPVTTRKIFVGGSGASQAWNRNWKGGIAELIFFTETSTEKERECVRYLLKHKHRLDIDAVYYSDASTLLRNMGAKTGDLFTTVIFVR